MLTLRQRAHVTTADWQYRAHIYEVYEYGDGKIVVVIDPRTDEHVRTLTHATVESQDGSLSRITGRGLDGEQEVWRTVKACARCAPPAVQPTADWDVPR